MDDSEPFPLSEMPKNWDGKTDMPRERETQIIGKEAETLPTNAGTATGDSF